MLIGYQLRLNRGNVVLYLIIIFDKWPGTLKKTQPGILGLRHIDKIK